MDQHPLHWLIDTVLSLYIWVLIIWVILSWLISFNVVSRGNAIIATISEATYRLTEPVLRPIRNFLPDLGGIDISPVVLILLIEFVRRLLPSLFY